MLRQHDVQRRRRREAQRRRRALWYATRPPTKRQRARAARDKARRLGKMHFVGQICKRGHVVHVRGKRGSRRWVSTGICVRCDQLRRAEMSPAARTRERKAHAAYGRRCTRALKVLRELGLTL